MLITIPQVDIFITKLKIYRYKYQYDKTNRKEYQNEKNSRHSVVTTLYEER